MQDLKTSTISYSMMMRTFFLGPSLHSDVRIRIGGGGGAGAAHRSSQVQSWSVGLWGVKMVASALQSANTSIVIVLCPPPGNGARKHSSAAAAVLATIPSR
eukprot:5246312-Pyramimonas_sp.AAC.1